MSQREPMNKVEDKKSELHPEFNMKGTEIELVNEVTENTSGITDEVISKFLEFVQGHLTKMESYGEVLCGEDISFYQVNKALARYMTVLNSLTGLHKSLILKSERANEMYDNWFAKEYMRIRTKENIASGSASKYLSKTELEYRTRTDNQDDFNKYKTHQILRKEDADFVERLIKNWGANLKVLTTIANNIQSEYYAVGGERKAESIRKAPTFKN